MGGARRAAVAGACRRIQLRMICIWVVQNLSICDGARRQVMDSHPVEGERGHRCGPFAVHPFAAPKPPLPPLLKEMRPMAENAPRPALAQFDLTGRLALVTGSSAGIGLALARGLAGAGARVVLNARHADKLAQAAQGLRREGLQVLTAAFDVTAGEAVRAAVDRIEAEHGAIDILVNNAGMQRRGPLEQFEEGHWHQLMQTNVDSVFLVGQAVARHMIARGRGKIVNVCSVQSELGRPGIAPYTASKGAVKMLTKGMAIDWGRHGIQVNGLGPGYFRTALNQALVDDAAFNDWLLGRTPARRWGELEDLVGAAIFLASDASRFVNGHILYVDGGVTASL